MAYEFELPDVGEGVSEGELVAWLVEEGERVTEDQPLAEVETDKALVEIPSPVDGTVLERHYEPGDIMLVDEVFITLEADAEAGEDAEADEAAPAEAESADEPAETTAADDQRVFAPPSVRQLARELDVDIGTVDGSGPGGRITEDDVEAAADGTAPETDTEPASEPEPEPTPSTDETDRERTLAAPATRRVAREEGVELDAVPASDEVEGEAFVSAEDVRAFASAEPTTAPPAEETPVERLPYRGVRRSIGQQMERSMYTAPHVTHHELVVVDDLVAAREDLKPIAEEQGISLTYLPFVIKALIASLRDHPKLNAELDEDAEEIRVKRYYNVGVAVATDAGLMVPVIKAADEKGMLTLASESRELAQKARERTITPEEFQDGTITITNFGAIGGDYATPIINYPEVAVIGLGELKQRPVVVDGSVEAAWTLPLSITIDHRVIDGAEVAQFADTFGTYLANPQRLLLA